jgi:mannan endo-1,4-beta-mannosidase
MGPSGERRRGRRHALAEPQAAHADPRHARRAEGLSKFLPLIDWNRFDRRCWNERVSVSVPSVEAFGCGDEGQALLWMQRTDVRADGTLDPDAAPVPVELRCPWRAGTYEVTHYETRDGRIVRQEQVECAGEELTISAELRTDLAFAVRRR